jgi:hypothetical protein
MPSRTSRLRGSSTERASPTGFEISLGLVDELAQAPIRLCILCDLAIPQAGLVFGQPLGKAPYLGGREFFDLGLDIFNASHEKKDTSTAGLPQAPFRRHSPDIHERKPPPSALQATVHAGW